MVGEGLGWAGVRQKNRAKEREEEGRERERELTEAPLSRLSYRAQEYVSFFLHLRQEKKVVASDYKDPDSLSWR